MSVSCFEIARRDANVDLLFLVVVGSAGCHFGFVYDALGKAFFSKWAIIDQDQHGGWSCFGEHLR